MILEMIRGDILQSPCLHIFFGVNTEGYNDSGFAGQVANNFWPELLKTGGNELGQVLVKNIGHKTFYAVVCHSLKDGWESADQYIKAAFDSQNFEEPCASVLMGAGFIGQMQGADVKSIIDAMRESNKSIVVYTL